MRLRPTPQSRRVAILTAAGAGSIAVVAALVALSGVRAGWIGWFAVAAAIATIIPAVGALTAGISVDERAVVVHRFGRSRTYDWPSIANVSVIERRASLPDGTEYHWFAVQRAPHRVAVPCLELVDGRVEELAMLASRADAAAPRVADQNAEQLLAARPGVANP